MVIGLTGPKLGGKGTTSAILQAELGAKAYTMSDILADICTRLHLEKSREHLIAVATGLRKTLGNDILAQVLKKDVLSAQDEIAVIDGIRMRSEIDLFKDIPGFTLVFIDAPLKMRYGRATTRGEKVGETELSFEEFTKEEEAPTETEVSSFRGQAAFVIENTGTIKDLEDEVHQMITKLNS
ncbi:MAG: AAA family ATPase [Candidatus Kerfeldbacteria bacterium]